VLASLFLLLTVFFHGKVMVQKTMVVALRMLSVVEWWTQLDFSPGYASFKLSKV
jgi:hypothetical protein